MVHIATHQKRGGSRGDKVSDAIGLQMADTFFSSTCRTTQGGFPQRREHRLQPSDIHNHLPLRTPGRRLSTSYFLQNYPVELLEVTFSKATGRRGDMGLTLRLDRQIAHCWNRSRLSGCGLEHTREGPPYPTRRSENRCKLYPRDRRSFHPGSPVSKHYWDLIYPARPRTTGRCPAIQTKRSTRHGGPTCTARRKLWRKCRNCKKEKLIQELTKHGLRPSKYTCIRTKGG